MIVVLSLCRPRLEDYLVARGMNVVALIPDTVRTARESTGAKYPIMTIDRWDNYTELACLAGQFETLGVTSVVTLDEPCIRAAGFLRDLLGIPGQGHESAVACTDKSVMKRRLAAAGIPVAEHRVVRSVREIREFLEQLGADIVVKPRHGFGALNTHRVSADNFYQLAADGAFDPPRDLPEYFRSTTLTAEIGQASFLVERFVDVVAEYHCELMLHEGSEVHCLAGRYAAPLLSGGPLGSVMLDPKSDEATTVCELTRAAASALGLNHGFAHCEIFRDRSGKWLVGEFASRPGGLLIPRVLQFNFGIDTLAALAEQVAGRRPHTPALSWPRIAFAWRGISARDSGIIVDIADESELLQRPGVVEAQVVALRGDYTTGSHGSMFDAAYVVCRGESPEQAERFADRAQNACHIFVEPATADVRAFATSTCRRSVGASVLGAKRTVRDEPRRIPLRSAPAVR